MPITLQQRMRARSDPRYWMLLCCYLTPFIVISLSIGILINSDPSFSVQNFYVPALNKLLNSTTDGDGGGDRTVIFFDLQLQNSMDFKGVRYDAVNLAFSYGTNATTAAAIATYTVPGFYQGKGKRAQRRDVAVVTGGGVVPWDETAVMMMRDLSSGGGSKAAGFKVDLSTKVRFKNYFWYSRKKRIVVGSRIFEVDDYGKKVGKKPIELKSGTPILRVGLLAVSSLLVSFFLLN